MLARFVVGLMLLLGALPSYAGTQGDPVFTAFADAREVLLNSYFEISFTLRNGEGQNFQAPSFKDFVVVSGPARSVSTTIINGQVSREISFNYSLKPRREGTFRIDVASIAVAGKTIKTQPVTIKVSKGRQGAVTKDDQCFILAEPNTNEAYVGQQISLDYKLYTTVNIESYNVLEESDYPGFYAEDLKRYEGRIVREVINGVQYTTKILKRVALFPQQAGILTIDPMQLQLGILEKDQRRSNSFFFNRKIKRQLAQTEPVEISVRSLPSPAPEKFTGAVGTFSLSSSPLGTDFSTDDVLSLKLRVEGNGDIKRVEAPRIEFPDGFEVYEPKILEESTSESDGELKSVKIFEYLALPRAVGVYELQPSFSFFDSDNGEFVTLIEDPFRISIKKGTRPDGPPVISDRSPEQNLDIRFIKQDTELNRTEGPFFGSGLFWVLSISPFLLLGGLVMVRRQQVIREGVDPTLLRRQQARKIAQKRLVQADEYRQQKKSRAFFDEVSKAMLGYVSDKLHIPTSAMTKDAVREKLKSLEIPDTLTERFLSIIKACEMALFAGKDQVEMMDDIYEKAVDGLMALEEHLG